MDFQSTLEDIDEVTKRAKVTIPAALIAREVEADLNKLVKNAPVKGFRPGKAPRQVVEKMHGERVHFEVANRLISSSLADVLEGAKLNVVGTPAVEITSIKPGEDISYTAEVSIYPQPAVEGYESFEIPMAKSEVASAEIDQVVDRIRKSRATLSPVSTRTTAAGDDVVEASVEVSVGDGAPGKAEPLVAGLGEGELPPELEEGIRGMAIGERKSVPVAFHAEHPNEHLRGKTVTYHVTLNGLKEKILPELTDQFAESLGAPDIKTVVELRMNIRNRLEQEHERQQKDTVRQRILEVLLQKNKFAVPAPLIDDEIRRMLVRAGIVDPAKVDVRAIDLERYRENLQEAADSRVRGTIIIDAIAEKEGIQASDQDIEAYVKEVADGGRVPLAEARKWLLGEERRLATMMEISRSKVLDFLEARAKIVAEEGKAA